MQPQPSPQAPKANKKDAVIALGIAFLAVVAFAVVTGRPDAGADVDAPSGVSLAHGKVLDALQQAALDKLVDACPGLRQYAGDITVTDVVPRERGFEVTFTLPESPRAVPSQFYASGQTCFAEVDAIAPGSVEVIKRPCVKTCLAKDADVPSSTAIRIR